MSTRLSLNGYQKYYLSLSILQCLTKRKKESKIPGGKANNWGISRGNNELMCRIVPSPPSVITKSETREYSRGLSSVVMLISIAYMAYMPIDNTNLAARHKSMMVRSISA